MRWPTLLALALLGCSPGSPSPEPECTPGATQACLGPGQCKGAQTCASGGDAWGECDCGGSAGAAGQSGGAAGTGAAGSAPCVSMKCVCYLSGELDAKCKEAFPVGGQWRGATCMQAPASGCTQLEFTDWCCL